jgi:hypothetical protein
MVRATAWEQKGLHFQLRVADGLRPAQNTSYVTNGTHGPASVLPAVESSKARKNRLLLHPTGRRSSACGLLLSQWRRRAGAGSLVRTTTSTSCYGPPADRLGLLSFPRGNDPGELVDMELLLHRMGHRPVEGSSLLPDCCTQGTGWQGHFHHPTGRLSSWWGCCTLGPLSDTPPPSLAHLHNAQPHYPGLTHPFTHHSPTLGPAVINLLP